jgi:glutamate-ammonia-ligase adenylyltransferase
MRVADWETLTAELEKQMSAVRGIFNTLIGDDEAEEQGMRSAGNG